jgi:SOS response regulatory protein OraA/RecX
VTLDAFFFNSPAAAPDATSVAAWARPSTFDAGAFGFAAPVRDSEDLQRVLALPRRPHLDLERHEDGAYDPSTAALVAHMNQRLQRPDNRARACRCRELRPPPADQPHAWPCIQSLQPEQAFALYEASIAGGLFGSIVAGGGKSALNFLLPVVMGLQPAVALVPSSLVKQLALEHELWSEHWLTANLVLHTTATKAPRAGRLVAGRPAVHVVPYNILSDEASTRLLEDLNPKLVMGDECHRISAEGSVRRSRLLRFSASHSETRFCWYSGTPTDKSVKDYAAQIALALRRGSPVPLSPKESERWAAALDPDPSAEPGALAALCAPGETLDDGFRRRLRDTRGVVATRASGVGAALNLREREAPPIPPVIAQLLDQPWETPAGEELETALESEDYLRTIACGFYYAWVFPDLRYYTDERGNRKLVPDDAAVVEEWLARRKAWRREVRDKLYRREVHLDSPELVERAAQRAHQREFMSRGLWPGTWPGYPGEDYRGDLPAWPAKTYVAWCGVRDRVRVVTEARWVDDYLARDAAAWATSRQRRTSGSAASRAGIVWYSHDALGQRIAKLAGLPLHNGGPGGDDRLRAERGERSIVCSIRAFGEGFDGLQRVFSEQLVVNPPSSGRAWEQLLARLHRKGHRAPEVDTWVYRHVRAMRCAIDRAVRRARYVQGHWDQSQRLLAANCDFELELDE